MIIVDDRGLIQKFTHRICVSGYDTFLSGWGDGENGSYAAWACRKEDAETVLKWVRSRGDMYLPRIETVRDLLKRVDHNVHVHIYVVDENHPARSGKYPYYPRGLVARISFNGEVAHRRHLDGK